MAVPQFPGRSPDPHTGFYVPFLYTNGTLISMINGTGKTSVTFLINGASLSLRLFSVFLLIPLFGILGYLWGMLASQILVFLSCLIFLIRFQENVFKNSSRSTGFT